jgi:hypothetical protein
MGPSEHHSRILMPLFTPSDRATDKSFDKLQQDRQTSLRGVTQKRFWVNPGDRGFAEIEKSP